MTRLEEAVWAAVYTRVLSSPVYSEGGNATLTDVVQRVTLNDPSRIGKAIDAAHEAVLNLRDAIGDAGAVVGLEIRAMNRSVR